MSRRWRRQPTRRRGNRGGHSVRQKNECTLVSCVLRIKLINGHQLLVYHMSLSAIEKVICGYKEDEAAFIDVALCVQQDVFQFEIT